MPPPDQLRHVLLVVKTSDWERYLDEGALGGDEDEDGDRERVLERLRAAHEEHAASAALVDKVFARTSLEVTRSSQPTKRETAAADLVVTVGGDGTFLRSAQRVDATPMLGVNSAPTWSVGHYCATSAERLAETLDAIRAGEAALTGLVRIAAWVGGRRMPHEALNDVLFAHVSPAASTRSLMRVGDDVAFHVSSGIWVCTASGSTGAMHSAGGERMAARDARLQYLVREPFHLDREGVRLRHGFVDHPLRLVARSPHLALFLDGHHRTYRVGLGVEVVLEVSERPLPVYGYRPLASAGP